MELLPPAWKVAEVHGASLEDRAPIIGQFARHLVRIQRDRTVGLANGPKCRGTTGLKLLEADQQRVLPMLAVRVVGRRVPIRKLPEFCGQLLLCQFHRVGSDCIKCTRTPESGAGSPCDGS